MPWQERDHVSLINELVALALKGELSIRELSDRFGVSRKTAYKWIARAKNGEALSNRSRRPHSSPRKTPPEMEAAVVRLRQQRPVWGGRKLWKTLGNQGLLNVPPPSTITSILHRHGLIDPAEALKHAPVQRFERPVPNELWQMDFKGHFETDGGRCHPLTVLDDHSRYAVGLAACENERSDTVKECLIAIFRRYGLPQELLCDNGPPWGTAGSDAEHTELTVWLLQAGVRVLHGRPCHPQTQGKDERFHRTLKCEVLSERFRHVPHTQTRFDGWRYDYNWVRPHEALDLDVPGSRYKPSARGYSESLRASDYSGCGVEVRSVDKNGQINMWGQRWRIGRAFAGQRVGIEATRDDGLFHVLFCGQIIKKLDRKAAQR
jgi:transposase InsO family protein